MQPSDRIRGGLEDICNSTRLRGVIRINRSLLPRLIMLQDLRFALRMLLKHRWFSAAVIATLAMGIGINSTVFTLVNAVLYKPVPIYGGERIVTVMLNQLDEPEDRQGVSWPDFLDLKAQTRSFDSLEALSYERGIVSETSLPPEHVEYATVSTGLFDMIRQPVAVGRGFSITDGDAGAEPVALISHRLWQNRYHGDPAVIGRGIKLDGKPVTVIGIMPDGFNFPNREDCWVPFQPTPELESRDQPAAMLYGLLQPGTSIAEAQADLGLILGRIAAEFPATHANFGMLVRTFHQTFNDGPIHIVFLMMLGAVGFVLLIACANVANMMLARAMTRRREIAVRAALGASRRQIIRQLLIESTVLSVIGGLLGLAFSGIGLHLFDLATSDVGRPYWIQFQMDWVAVAYFAAITLSTGMAFGLVPALRASRVDLTTAIKDGTPGAGASRNRLTGVLVVLQFALTVVLLAGAGAMVRSFFLADQLNNFVKPDSILTARLQLPDDEGERYQSAESRQQFFDQLLPTLNRLPGVTVSAAATQFPGMGAHLRGLEFNGRPNPDPTKPPSGGMVIGTPDYLEAIALPLLRGRKFTALRIAGEPGREAAIVTQAFAARYWPGEDALGQSFRLALDKEDQSKADASPNPWMEIVGISADIDQSPHDPEAPPVFFVPYSQHSWAWVGILVRSRGDAPSLALPVRQAVQAIDPDLALYDVQTLTAGLDRQRWFLRVFGSVFSVFAATGLLMAALGIYGVIAHQTAQRTREIGIRIALGATGQNIARLVLSRGLWQLAIGIGLGLCGAFGATQVMVNVGLIIGMSPRDPVLFGGIVMLLLGVGLAACWLPARRATRVAPTEALRVD